MNKINLRIKHHKATTDAPASPKDGSEQGAPRRKRFWRSRHVQRAAQLSLYVAAGLLMLFWIGYGLFSFWHAKGTQARSQNTARLQTVAADVEALPMPETVGYGKTSSSLPTVTYRYEQTRKQIDELRPVRYSLLNSLPNQWFDNGVMSKAGKVLDDVQSTLKTSEQALTITAKLLQYDPATDLQPYTSGAETDAAERLDKTNQGISGVITELQKSSIPYRSQLIEHAQMLQDKATSLQPQDVPAWVKQVNAVQEAMLSTIQTNTATPLRTQTAELRELTQQQ